MTDTITIQMAVASDTPLKEMGVMNMDNGEPFEMLNFTQEENVKHTIRSVTFAAPEENTYNLGVQTTDWNGNVTVGPTTSQSRWTRRHPAVN